MGNLQILRHKATTIIGALIVIFGILCQPNVLALLPARYGQIITAVGGILTIIGRSIIAPTAAPQDTKEPE